MSKQEKLLALADQIDHEKLWKWAGIERDNMTDDQRARLDAGVMLRRYADILEPGRWLLIPPTGCMQFSAGTLDRVIEIAKRDEARRQPLTRCAAGRDGECGHAQCPQLRDNEPATSARHCPLDNHHEADT